MEHDQRLRLIQKVYKPHRVIRLKRIVLCDRLDAEGADIPIVGFHGVNQGLHGIRIEIVIGIQEKHILSRNMLQAFIAGAGSRIIVIIELDQLDVRPGSRHFLSLFDVFGLRVMKRDHPFDVLKPHRLSDHRIHASLELGEICIVKGCGYR